MSIHNQPFAPFGNMVVVMSAPLASKSKRRYNRYNWVHGGIKI